MNRRSLRPVMTRLCAAAALLTLFVGSAPSVVAQVGKISGIVTDAETGDTVPGANVLVVGTPYGAASNQEGRFDVIGVPPGDYSVRVTFIGFVPTVIENVRVQSGLTTRLDVQLGGTAIDLGEDVVITAERPPVQPDVTSSVQYLDFREMAELPVSSTAEALFVQAGVFFDTQPIEGGLGGSGRGEPRYAVRGGDQTEVMWLLDGVRTTSLIEGRADQGGSYTTVNPHAVQELQILTGGFNAEYGGAQSGIVNVVSKEGDEKLEATFEYLYGPPGQRHFGNYLFDPETQREFIDNTLADGSLDPAWWTPLRQSQVYDYREIADHHAWGSLGGALPVLDGRFFVAGQFNREAYAFPRPIDQRELDDVLGNVVLRPSQATKLRLNGLVSRSLHSTLQENGDFTNQSKYYRGWGSVLRARHALASAAWTHILGSTLYYDVKLSAFSLDLKEVPSEFARLGRSVRPTIFGFQRYDAFENEPFDAFTFLYDRHERVGDVSLDGSVTWQANTANLIKAGLVGRINSYDEKQSYRYPSFTDNSRYWINRGLDEEYFPIEIAGYVQDKMEFKSMILNLGLRYDYFDPNRDWFTSRDLFNLALDPLFDPALDPDGDQVDANGRVRYSFENVLDKPRSPVESFHRISPRVGVSFPITAQSVLHFNYGHFYQMPPLDRMFEFGYFKPLYIVQRQQAEDELAASEGRDPRHIASNLGDPERVVALSLGAMKPEKTISFEVGIAQQFGDLAVLNVTGFYKDVFDQVLPRVGLFDRGVFGYDPLLGRNSTVGFASNFSGDYGDARGFEINMRTLASKYATFDFNYSFSRSTQGRATPGRVDYDSTGLPSFTYDSDASRRLATEKTFSRPHLFRANLYLTYPEGGRNAWDRVLEGSSLSLLGRYVSGRSFTYLGPDDPPDTVDNQRFPAIQQLDLRVEKRLNVGVHSMSIYANVTNALNTKNLRSYGDALFDAEATSNYIEDGTVSTVDGGGYDISWQNYFEPRRVLFGIRYDFR